MGAAPGDVVAFAWSGSWQQIPVQVDERKLLDLRAAYPTPFACAANSPCYAPFSTPGEAPLCRPGHARRGRLRPRRSTPTTRSRSWPRTPAPRPGAAPYPAGVVAGSRVEIVVTDPLDGGRRLRLPLPPRRLARPGRRPAVRELLLHPRPRAPILSTYRLAAGSNPETLDASSRPTTRVAFTDRWRESRAARPPRRRHRRRHPRPQREPVHPRLLRAQHASPSPGGEGAFLTNRSGPVRAIRAFLGANSGPMTEHQQIFYEGREEDTTFLRVHGIPAVMSFLDYSAAATGMTYRNNNNLAGVTIDGVADAVAAGQLTWESVDGAAGRPHERPHLEHHGGREQVHLVLPRPGEPAGRADPLPGRRRLLRRERPLHERLDQLDRRACERQRPGRPPHQSTRTTFFDAPGTAERARCAASRSPRG